MGASGKTWCIQSTTRLHRRMPPASHAQCYLRLAVFHPQPSFGWLLDLFIVDHFAAKHGAEQILISSATVQFSMYQIS